MKILRKAPSVRGRTLQDRACDGTLFSKKCRVVNRYEICVTFAQSSLLSLIR